MVPSASIAHSVRATAGSVGTSAAANQPPRATTS